jgi:hypothetical protein
VKGFQVDTISNNNKCLIMIKKISALKFLMLSILLAYGCSKKGDSPNSNSTDVTLIENVAGTYKNGTLYVYKTDNNGWDQLIGTDPNFSFTVTYLGNNKCRVSISTTLPIGTNTFEVPLTSKNTLLQNVWMQYGFSDDPDVTKSNFVLAIELTKTNASPNILAKGSIAYSPHRLITVPGTIKFNGDGTR